MNKFTTRATSMALAAAMALGMVSTALAADGQVNITFADGTTTTLVNTSTINLHKIGETDVESVVISAGDATEIYNDFSELISDTLPGGTEYQITTVTENGDTYLQFKYLNTLSDDIDIVVTDKDVTYSVNANSGAYGQNSNLGGTATCTMTAEAVETVNGGDGYSVTYMPKSGQEIVKLNLRVDAADGAGKLVDPVTGTVVVDNQTFVVTDNGNGSVTVKVSSVTRNLFISALTQDETTKYALNITTDMHCTSDISSTKLTEGTTKQIVFTPSTGYTMKTISITDGTKSGAISLDDESVDVNGHTYSLTRNLDGSAILEVPAMEADVSISATSANDISYIHISTPSSVYSNFSGTTWIDNGDSFEFYLEPDSDTVLKTLTITTADGSHTYDITPETIDDYDNDFTDDYSRYYNGTYWTSYGYGKINMSYDSKGRLVVFLSNVHENLEFDVNARDTKHTVKVSGDNGVSYEASRYILDDGDDWTLTFTPAKSKYTIKKLTINYGETTYTVNTTKDTSVRIDGNRWDVHVDSDGVVTLEMLDVGQDVTVKAASDYSSEGTMRISATSDSHSTINYTGANPFDDDDSSTVTFYTDKNYVISKVTFKVGSKIDTVEPFDETLTIGGETYDIIWVDNTEFKIYFENLPGSMTITSKAVKGDVIEVPDDGEKEEDENNDSNIITNTTVYHASYMHGYTDGSFQPNGNLTRAAAVAMLTRGIMGMQDVTLNANYGGLSYFSDVDSSFWAAGPINFALSCGYLDFFNDGSGKFNPTKPITRAEFLALLCEIQGIDVSDVNTESQYSDVSSTHWAAQYINYATNAGWVQGYGETFQPDSAVTRAAMCVMTNHVLGRAIDGTTLSQASSPYNDVPITFWAFADIYEASYSHTAIIKDGIEAWG